MTNKFIATIAAALLFSLGLRAQQPAPQPQQPAAAADQGPKAKEKFKNIKVLDIPASRLRDTMEYFTAALGAQCNLCHVTGPTADFASDERRPKATARKMIQMVDTFNASQKDITLTCATCHHGRNQPERTPPLAVEMTPAEAAAAAQRAAQRGAGPQGGGAPQGAPNPNQPPAAPPAGGAPAGAPPAQGQPGPGGQGRGSVPPPTETIDQVIDKFVAAMGGQAALAQAKTRVLHGTQTTRDLVTVPITVQEKASGEYRIDIDQKPQPTVRVFDGKNAWTVAFGNTHDLEGIQAAQVSRPSEFGLPINIKQRYQTLQVGRYGNVDGVETIIVTGRANADVTEQLHFERQSGLLKRRTIQTRTPYGALVEQVDYSDYRDAGGIKMPFVVKYTNWREATTEKFTDAKINAPIDDSAFVKK